MTAAKQADKQPFEQSCLPDDDLAQLKKDLLERLRSLLFVHRRRTGRRLVVVRHVVVAHSSTTVARHGRSLVSASMSTLSRFPGFARERAELHTSYPCCMTADSGDESGDEEVTSDESEDARLAELELGEVDVAAIVEEERVAARRLSAIEAGRRKGGLLGAAAAGAMIGLRDIYEGPPKEDEIVMVSESSGEPGDIDKDGIEVTVGDVDVWAPPPSPDQT
jgi:hypothetical protein